MTARQLGWAAAFCALAWFAIGCGDEGSSEPAGPTGQDGDEIVDDSPEDDLPEAEDDPIEDLDPEGEVPDEEPIEPDPELSFCEAHACGADHETGEWCGECERGKGCAADGICGDWPPDIDTFYNGHSDWALPACSHDDDPGEAMAGATNAYWVKTMTTVETTCPAGLGSVHHMFNPGNQATEDTSVPVYGSCLEYSDGQWGTVYGGVAVWGASWRDRFLEYDYVINWRAIIDHNLPTPTGVGIAHLTDLPAWGGECSIIFDVTYERCPEHRADCGQHPKPW